ncbi:50S ribosomal protein L32 [Candidatus Uhrbacteria bacterium]|nr:50S ribosomal protein L32 [Candidatus Uhrbacteria bacterium]
MGLPGHRRTSSHKRRRASHFALKRVNLAKCAQCAKPVLPHHGCTACGWYAGRKVVTKPQADSRTPHAKRA